MSTRRSLSASPLPSLPSPLAATRALLAGMTMMAGVLTLGGLGAGQALAAAPAQGGTTPPSLLMPGAAPAAPAAPAAGKPAMGAAPAPSAASTQCNLPKTAPHIPNGATATEAEMRAAHQELQTYVNIGQMFVGCVDNVINSHPKQVTVAAYLRDTALQNAVVNNMELLARAFNDQLHIYKARTGKAPVVKK